MRGSLRYRHAEGISCGCETRSVVAEALEDDFRRLIGLLTVAPDRLAEMTELAIQSEYGIAGSPDNQDLEQQKQAAIAKCHRRIAAARDLFLEGDMTREEYLKHKIENERQIAHWESRTTETEKAALELRMCMEALEQITRLWDTGSNEDRQNLACMIFEYLVYDLDLRQIVDFRLKPWADRYLVLRAALYRSDSGDAAPPTTPATPLTGSGTKENATLDSLKSSTVSCPIGASNPCFGLERATS
jgi:hypothetical protein